MTYDLIVSALWASSATSVCFWLFGPRNSGFHYGPIWGTFILSFIFAVYFLLAFLLNRYWYPF